MPTAAQEFQIPVPHYGDPTHKEEVPWCNGKPVM